MFNEVFLNWGGDDGTMKVPPPTGILSTGTSRWKSIPIGEHFSQANVRLGGAGRGGRREGALAYRVTAAMQPARAKTATASRAAAQIETIITGFFPLGTFRPFLFDEPIMTDRTYTAVACALHFCRLAPRQPDGPLRSRRVIATSSANASCALGARLGEELVGA